MPDKEHTRGMVSTEDPNELLRLGKSYFLGIGINNYKEFPKLNNAVRDVQDFAKTLEEKYELDEAITLFDEAATRDNIINRLDDLSKRLHIGDKLIIYYSGHGHLNEKNRGFWIPHDAKPGYTSRYIANSRIRDYLNDIAASHTLLISDACFSGALFVRGAQRSSAAVAEELEQRISRWAICSGRHDEEVADGPPGGNSPFASSILEILNQNQRPYLKVASLADQVIEQTRANYEQLPEGNPIHGVGHKGGQYIFKLKQNETIIWETAKAKNTIAAYSLYLQDFRQGKYADDALKAIETLEDKSAWEVARKSGRISAYQKYLMDFPKGAFASEARAAITKLQGAVKTEPPRPAPKADAESQNYALNTFLGKHRSKLLLSALGLILIIILFQFLPSFGENNNPEKESETNAKTFKDKAGQTYSYLTMPDGKEWMTQNLNFEVPDSYCYDNQQNYCNDHGRLYTWEAAKTACAALGNGWRLPSREDWMGLIGHYGGVYSYENNDGKAAFNALAENGGTGFEAMLSGKGHGKTVFSDIGRNGSYWTATSEDDKKAHTIHFDGVGNTIQSYGIAKTDLHSCRCVRDTSQKENIPAEKETEEKQIGKTETPPKPKPSNPVKKNHGCRWQ